MARMAKGEERSRVTFVEEGQGPRLLAQRAQRAVAEATVVVRDHGDASASLVQHALASSGARVVRPYVGPLAASVREEIVALRAAGIDLEVVPGPGAVALLGAFAGLLFPARVMTMAGDGTRSAPAPDGAELPEGVAWVVSCRTPAEAAEAAGRLAGQGLAGEAALAVTALGTPDQRVVEGSLAAVAEHVGRLVEHGAVHLVVGACARPEARARGAWFEGRPLFGKRVLVTRPAGQAEATSALLEDHGAKALLLPSIALHPPRDLQAMEDALAALDRYDWVAFTSANGVERVGDALWASARDARAFGKAKIAAIGPATAKALAPYGLRADLVAKEFKGEGLAEEMVAAFARAPAGGDAPVKVLLLRAQVAREALPDALRAAGCLVDVVAVYETRAVGPEEGQALRQAIEAGDVDAVTFTSSSTVDHFCELVGPAAKALLRRTLVASIGPITTASAEARGVRVDVEATEYTLPGLMWALEKAFQTALRPAPAPAGGAPGAAGAGAGSPPKLPRD